MGFFRASRSHVRGGFTLIELLVVIAIIAILAAIITPIFASSREAARRIRCASHMRSVGVSIVVYAEDYGGRLPLAAYTVSQSEYLTWNELTDRYIKNKQIWYCPSSRVKKIDDNGKRTSHYGYNAHYLTDMKTDFSNADLHRGIVYSEIRRPPQTIVMADTKGDIAADSTENEGIYLLAPSMPDSPYWGRPNYLHKDGCNVFWADGHVSWQSPEKFYQDQVPTDKYFDLY